MVKKYDVNERNQINLPTHPILIQTPQHNLIIDAGIGNGKLNENNCVILVLMKKVKLLKI